MGAAMIKEKLAKYPQGIDEHKVEEVYSMFPLFANEDDLTAFCDSYGTHGIEMLYKGVDDLMNGFFRYYDGYHCKRRELFNLERKLAAASEALRAAEAELGSKEGSAASDAVIAIKALL
jgi:hypothetical protein